VPRLSQVSRSIPRHLLKKFKITTPSRRGRGIEYPATQWAASERATGPCAYPVSTTFVRRPTLTTRSCRRRAQKGDSDPHSRF
jgi:hypothetical protein